MRLPFLRLLSVVLIHTLCFAGTSVAEPPQRQLPGFAPLPVPESKPVCIVLSVGAEKGVAHIGVLEALKLRRTYPSCVFGNSMGALVGGLYASNPNYDLRTQYRAIMGQYVRRTKKEVGDGGLLGVILAAVTGVATGGLGPALLVGGTSAAVAAGSVKPADRERLVKVLDTHMNGVDIEGLPILMDPHANGAAIEGVPIQYGTWFLSLSPGLAVVPVTRGNLASAIGSSITNPLIFPGSKIESGARLDPGADRIAAVPLEDACKLRPDAHFIVSNVTGRPVYFSTEMKCSYQVIDVKTPDADPAEVLAANGPGFERMVWAGYAAVLLTPSVSAAF